MSLSGENVNGLGAEILKRSKVNKGQAFTIHERQTLGIHGLLPPAVRTDEEQENIVLENFSRYGRPLDQYIYLMGLQDRNEKLFYRMIVKHIELMMPVIYTPTVGLACQKYGLIYRNPRGLFISIHDKGHIYDVLCNWPENDVKAICVTDGERILGLGDLGSYGMGIPVGKLALYTACAGVKPNECLPITLDVGTNNETLLEDPLYIGLRQKRLRGTEYDDFIDEFMEACVKKYGHQVLIQFEDFGNSNAFRLISKYQQKYCTFNDDIQGTAAVTVAGLIASMRISKKKITDQKILFQGAGEAAIGIANLIVKLMEEEGMSRNKALKNIFMVDSKGLVVKDRPSGGVTEHKAPFAKEMNPVSTLEEAVKVIKPSAIVGVAAIHGAFTKQVIEDMASFNEHPIIFALSNPTSKAECTAEEAYTLTQGKCIFASGSPFDAVTVGDKTFTPGQGNNAYIFPGVALAVVLCKVHHIADAVFLKAAQSLASQVNDANIEEGRVYPPLNSIREVSLRIAVDLASYFYKNNMASYYPEPIDKNEFIRSQLYSTSYNDYIPSTWKWP